MRRSKSHTSSASWSSFEFFNSLFNRTARKWQQPRLGPGFKAMKRCPTCNKTFTDQNLSFCTDDGTPLITLTPEDQRAKITSSNRSKDSAAPSYDASDWKAPSYQPPSGYV